MRTDLLANCVYNRYQTKLGGDFMSPLDAFESSQMRIVTKPQNFNFSNVEKADALIKQVAKGAGTGALTVATPLVGLVADIAESIGTPITSEPVVKPLQNIVKAINTSIPTALKTMPYSASLGLSGAGLAGLLALSARNSRPASLGTVIRNLKLR